MAQTANYEKQPLAAAVQRAVQPNELDLRLLNICGLNPWDGHDSAGRKQMMSSHLGQRLTISGATERRNQTGMENEFGKYTMAIRMPATGQIIKVIDRYRKTYGLDSIEVNPETIAIYEDLDAGCFDIMKIEKFCSQHQYFGFQYIFRPVIHDIRKEAYIKKDTVIADSPAIDPKTGAYKLGIELNMVLLSIPGVSEDGIIISRDVLPKLSFKTYETRVIEFGSRMFPTNLYGVDGKFKAYPDIGEMIKSDGQGRGILINLRTYDKNLAVVEQSTKALQQIDFTYDKPVYVGEGGRVVDIKIHHDNAVNPSPTPFGMETQSKRYDNARRHFYKEILDEYDRLKYDHKRNNRELKLSPRFHQLVVEAISVVGKDDGQKVFKLYRQAPLDDFRIEFTVEYDMIPTDGFKLTDFHGGKGVICEIWEPWQMPVDAEGNRADMIMDPNSRISRMNLGGPLEMFINGSSRDTSKFVREMMRYGNPDDNALMMQNRGIGRVMEGWSKDLSTRSDIEVMNAWNFLMGYYGMTSPKMLEMFNGGRYKKTPREHVEHICKEGVYLYLPPDNPAEAEVMVEQVNTYYPSCYGPVSYVGRSGRHVVTKNPARIATCYIMLLEKIGDDWTAVSSGKTQHYGVLAQVTNSDKYTQPTRQQAIRALGEAEVRIYTSYVGTRVTAEQMDRNNNPKTHEHICYELMRAEKPTDIYCAVDRNVIPFGGAKPQQLVKHIGECAGWEFCYEPYDPGPMHGMMVPQTQVGVTLH